MHQLKTHLKNRRTNFMMIHNKQGTQYLKITSCSYWETLMQGTGCSELEKQQWAVVRESQRVEKMNENRAVLLSFCTLNCLSIMNTCFEKGDVYKYIWQHPGSNLWHCIDYILMRQYQRKFCHDVSVVRKANC